MCQTNTHSVIHTLNFLLFGLGWSRLNGIEENNPYDQVLYLAIKQHCSHRQSNKLSILSHHINSSHHTLLPWSFDWWLFNNTRETCAIVDTRTVEIRFHNSGSTFVFLIHRAIVFRIGNTVSDYLQFQNTTKLIRLYGFLRRCLRLKPV